MDLGIFAKTFPGSDPLSVLTAAKTAGYRTVQYNLVCSGLSSMPDEIGAHVPLEITNAVTETGIGLCAVSGTFNMIHPKREKRDVGLKRLGIIASCAREMGTDLITLCTGTRDAEDQWRGHRDNRTSEAWSDLLNSMETAVEYAERHDVFLGIEPELANVVDSASKAKKLIDDLKTDRIRIVFDPANLFEIASLEEQRKIISHGIDLLGPHIGIAHAKDRFADGSFATAGKGVLDYAHFIGELTQIGFKGPMVTHGLSKDEAGEVCTFLDGILNAAGARCP